MLGVEVGKGVGVSVGGAAGAAGVGPGTKTTTRERSTVGVGSSASTVVVAGDVGVVSWEGSSGVLLVAVAASGPTVSGVIRPDGVSVGDSAGVAAGSVTVGSVTVGSVTVGSGVAVKVGTGINVLGSTPGGMMITPGVPALGGVTTTSAWSDSGVGVNVGAGGRVAAGVGVGRRKSSVGEQATTVNNQATSPIRSTGVRRARCRLLRTAGAIVAFNKSVGCRVITFAELRVALSIGWAPNWEHHHF